MVRLVKNILEIKKNNIEPFLENILLVLEFSNFFTIIHINLVRCNLIFYYKNYTNFHLPNQIVFPIALSKANTRSKPNKNRI